MPEDSRHPEEGALSPARGSSHTRLPRLQDLQILEQLEDGAYSGQGLRTERRGKEAARGTRIKDGLRRVVLGQCGFIHCDERTVLVVGCSWKIGV